MNIFVINSGSSSIKYQLFKMPSQKPVCTGLIERVGDKNAAITHKTFIDDQEKVLNYTLDIPDFEAGLKKVNELLTDPASGVIKNTAEIEVAGHRVVHGGATFTSTTLVTPEVMEKFKLTFQMAPLHNPSAYKGIEVAQKIFFNAKQVLVFDTAFHQTIPEIAFRFAIPNSFYTNEHIRVYGFHGTSHKYVSRKAAEHLKRNDLKMISIHLGNGCSMAALKDGKSIDTSMGLGPLSGLIMGTRSGDLDPTVTFYLMDQLGYDSKKLSTLLNKQSGMLGLTGFNDMRDIRKAMKEGNEEAKLAYDMYAYRIKKFIGAYASIMNGLDAVIFTAGVGENDALVREMVCTDMQFLGMNFDQDKNNTRSEGIKEISREDSKVQILVVPTNEELEIAEQCYELVK